MMSTSHPPAEPPPTYEDATGSSFTPSQGIRRVSTDGPAARTERNGIPPEARRSMEDEGRELPEGWVRSFDAETQHQFFVDTRANPPRSIWVHPYDDEEFLSTLSPEERKNHSRMQRTMTLEDLAAEDSDNDGAQSRPGSRGKATAAVAGSSSEPQPTGFHKFSRKLKDKVTGQTHTEREQARVRRAEQGARLTSFTLAPAKHWFAPSRLVNRNSYAKTPKGTDVYIESPYGPHAPRGAYGYNPYANAQRLQGPNIRFIRPSAPYGRPYGYGYGGGAGLPIAAGFLGGAMLGGALF